MNVDFVDLHDDRVVARFYPRSCRREPGVETLLADLIAQSLPERRGYVSVSLLVHCYDKS